MEASVAMPGTTGQQGFSLVETMVALGVLTVGVLGSAAVLATGMQHLSSSPADVIVAQKAAQTIEAVFSARDSGKVTWPHVRNVRGASGNDGGIFLDGPQSIHKAGPDGLVNTGDDEIALETTSSPGRDQRFQTADDETAPLSQYTREISIRDVANQNGQLNGQVRKVTVTMTYKSGPTTKTYTLVTFISAYS
jgi:type II secretory pathway pseudopilin PulG